VRGLKSEKIIENVRLREREREERILVLS